MDLEVRVRKTRAIGHLTFISTDNSDVFLLLAHLPGFKKADIEVQANETGTEITVSGGGRIEPLELVNVFRIVNIATRAKVEGFCQSFLVPENTNLKKVDAVFDDEEEILMILIPKLVKEQTKEILSGEASCGGGNDEFLEEEEEEEELLNNFHEPILDLIELENEDKNKNTDIPADLPGEGDTVRISDQLPCFPKKAEDIDEKLFDHDTNVEAIIPLSKYEREEEIVDKHVPNKVRVEDNNSSTKLPEEEATKTQESTESEKLNQTTGIEPYKEDIPRCEEPPYSEETVDSLGTNQIQEKQESEGQTSSPNFKPFEPTVPEHIQEDEPTDEYNKDAENEEGSQTVEETEDENQMLIREKKRIVKRNSRFTLKPTSFFARSVFMFVVVVTVIHFLKGKKTTLKFWRTRNPK